MSNLKYKHTAYTSAQWASLNPVIVENEIVIESDTKRTKIGNGISTYNELEYADANSVGNSLGSIKPTDAAPTPARNGNYTFSIGGNKPAWLTAEPLVTTVKAGDGVAVVYTAPSSYTYTHVDVGGAFETELSKKGWKTCEILPAGANVSLINNAGTWTLTIPTACRISLKDGGRLQPSVNVSINLDSGVINSLFYKSNNTIIKDTTGTYVPNADEYLFAVINSAYIASGGFWTTTPIIEISGKKYGYGAPKMGTEDLILDYSGGVSKPLAAEVGKSLKASIDANTLLLSKKNWKTCEILPAAANVTLVNTSGIWTLTIPTACRIAIKDGNRLQPASNVSIDLSAGALNSLFYKSNNTIIKDITGTYVPNSDEYLFAVINSSYITVGGFWISSPIIEISGKKYGIGVYKFDVSDIVNNLTTGGTAVPLSAEQGKSLKSLIDNEVLARQNAVSSLNTNLYVTQTSLSSGYYDKKLPTLTGNPVGASTLKSILFDVIPGQTWHIITTPRNDGVAYLFYDIAGNLVSFYPYGGTGVTLTLDVLIPDNIVKMGVNCDTSYLDTFAITKTGDLKYLLGKIAEIESDILEANNRIDDLEYGGIDETLSPKNKVIYTLGSSTIMLMGNIVTDGVRDWTELKQLVGATELYNLGLGGSAWQRKSTDTDTPLPDDGATNFVSNQVKWLKRLVDTLNYPTPDIIFIQATNGYNNSGITDNFTEVMGYSFTDLESNVNGIRSTFFGGARYAIELLNRYFPAATYYIADGLQADEGEPYPRGWAYVNSGYEALKKICDRYAVPFIATSKELGIVDLFENGSTYSTAYIAPTGVATTNGNAILTLSEYNLSIPLTTSMTISDIAAAIASNVNGNAGNWTATVENDVVVLSVVKAEGAVPVYNQNGTSSTVDITFSQFGSGYDGIYLGTDGLHPNAKGKTLISRCIAKNIINRYFKKQ